MRRCGSCQLCCKLLAVKSGWVGPGTNTFHGLEKPAGVRCQHQRAGKGCAIYEVRPHCCEAFVCWWLAGDDAHDLPRPDRGHFVVDISPDVIWVNGQRALVLQVWIDPAFPDAHRHPGLRAFLARQAADNGMAALIRYDSRRAMLLLAPCLSPTGAWYEGESMCANRTETTAAERAEAMRAAGLRLEVNGA